MASEEEDRDGLIDDLIDAVPVLEGTGHTLINNARRAAFVTDLARKIDLYPVIAARWGFIDEVEMADFLKTSPALRRLIKEERAVWFSNENSEVRGRELARRGTVECVPEAVNIALNPEITPSTRLDAIRTCARIAGMDGPGSREAAYAQAEGASRFSVVINFPSAGKTETITVAPPTVSGEPEITPQRNLIEHG